MGQNALVEGPVVGGRYAPTSSGEPTFINLGRDYPDQTRFQLVIWGNNRSRFPPTPESAYLGKTICVQGTVQSYRGVPELIVASPDVVHPALR